MFYQNQIDQCDKMLDVVLNKMGNNGGGKVKESKRKSIRHHKPKVQKLGDNLLDIFENKDATLIGGVTDYTWLRLLSEIGTDLSRWPSEKHFTSWLGLAPGQNHSGKKRKNARKKGKPMGGQIFRQISQGLLNSKNIALGAFGRRIRARKGPSVAIKAMARKLAATYWRTMVHVLEYAENGVKKYEEQMLKQKMKSFLRLANELNMHNADKLLVT